MNLTDCLHCELPIHQDELGEWFDSEGDRTCPDNVDTCEHETLAEFNERTLTDDNERRTARR